MDDSSRVDDVAAHYASVMAGLSDPQRKAVTHDDGALIVLAGPGTGKTRVITARVAHMINERGIEPDRIAAVTFSNKAAGELGERLGGLIGQTQAARVSASTFHQLGLGIIRRFGDVLGVASDPVLIDSAQRNMLVMEIIRDHRLYRRSLGRGIERARDHAVEVMSCLRNLGWWSRDARDWSEDRRSVIDTLGEELRDEERYELDRFDDAVTVYERFTQACLDRGWMDFDDLIMLPTRLIRQDDLVASVVRSDCRHVVVDEFQDVNMAQIEMIRAVCPPEHGPDLCVVGDDDQSIYGFRGADDRAFAHFAQIWPGAPTIELTENYRSADCVVEASNAVMMNAALRFAPDKVGRSHQGDIDGSGLELVRVQSDQEISEAIVSLLLRMIDEGGEGFGLSDVAIIARTNTDLERIARMLDLEGIPFELRDRRAPMDDPGAQDVLAWARLVTETGGSGEIRRVLVRGPYRCDAFALGRLIGRHASMQTRYKAGQEDEQDPGGLLDWLCACQDPKIAQCAAMMREQLRELSAVASARDAGETLIEIIKGSGVVHRDLEDGHGRARRIESLAALLRFARTRADRFEQPGDLAAFLRYYDLLDRSEQSLGELPEERVEDAGLMEPSESNGRVMLLTAHKSKGLEFDTVIVPRVTSPHGYPKMSGGNGSEGFPSGLIDRGDDPRDDKQRRYDEERRVFYVALTRAKRRAVMLGKIPKKTTSVNFALELCDAMGDRLSECFASDLFDPAHQRDEVRRLGAEFKSRSAIRDAFNEARRASRLSAATALDANERGEIDHEALRLQLDRAGQRAAMIEHVRSKGELPDWCEDAQDLALGQSLIDMMARDGARQEQALHPPLSGPLNLSFTKISKYLRCPRCYLAEFVFKISGDDSIHSVVGKAVHEALERFYQKWRDADAEGAAAPGRDSLIELTRAEFLRRWPRDRAVDQDWLDRCLAMASTAWDQFHREEAHIIELERKHTMSFLCDGINHEIMGVIDRVDATGSGGLRVIDYKTGRSRDELINPASDDLQMGIYAMAVEQIHGEPGPGSVCEYWLLQEGLVGQIGFDALDMEKIHKKINKAIRGMMSGDWTRSSRCKGDDAACSIFDQRTNLANLNHSDTDPVHPYVPDIGLE